MLYMQQTNNAPRKLYRKKTLVHFAFSSSSSPLKIKNRHSTRTCEDTLLGSENITKNNTQFTAKIIVKEIIKVSKVKNQIKKTEIYKAHKSFDEELLSPIQSVPIVFFGSEDKSFISALKMI